MRYLRTEKLRSFHLRPFIVLTITKRAHYKAKRIRVRVRVRVRVTVTVRACVSCSSTRGVVRVRVRVRVGAWMSQCREQSQVSRFTPGSALL